MSKEPAQPRFTRSDRRRLAKALAQTRLARVYRRLEALLLVAEGQSVSEAARRVRSNRTSVHRWINEYVRTRDPAVLEDRARSGRPRTAPALSAECIRAALQQDPQALGYRATTWTVPLLATYLSDQLGCPVRQRTLRRRLHAWGYRWKRPRHVYTGRPAARELGSKKGLSSAA